MNRELETTVEASSSATLRRGRPWLVILRGGAVDTLPLPERGRLTIGRGASADLTLDDAEVSREHAHLFVDGDRVEIVDLGGVNGTRFQGERLRAHERVLLPFGAGVDLGSATLIVQHFRSPPVRRLLTHASFEARLEDECRRRPAAFTVLRIAAEGEAEASAVEDALTAVVPGGIIASVAPGEYEALLVGLDVARSKKVIKAVEDALGARGLSPLVGAATYPQDGRDHHALLAAASDALAGDDEDLARGVIIQSPAMVDLYRLADRVARGNISVLILGESGSGKEVFAAELHRRSPRAERPYLRINCAALPETLLESELFGYEKGAFSGADKSKPGLLETANGGTVFLDEIGEMPLSLQAKMLRVLEERQLRRLGSLEAISIDVRFVFATNRDLEEEVADARFREDLYFRLAGISVSIPPLRERREEILPLARLFAKKAAGELGLPEPEITERAAEMLVGYGWPGNIRELRNVMERAVLLAYGDPIGAEHLPVDKMTATWAPRAPRAPAAAPPEAGSERDRIVRALEECGGNQTRAAKLLGISRRTLSTRLNEMKLPRPRKGNP